MLKRSLPPILGILFVVGCSDAPVRPDRSAAPLGFQPALASEAAPAPRNFVAVLSGADNNVQTRARGLAKFRLSPDGTELHYKLNVANIEDVFMAHIHIAPAGSNGPIGVWLYPFVPGPQPIPGRFSGVLAEGVITDAQIMGGVPGGTLADLIDVMRDGGAYVNVHTAANLGGEVRGQIRIPVGHIGS